MASLAEQKISQIALKKHQPHRDSSVRWFFGLIRLPMIESEDLKLSHVVLLLTEMCLFFAV
jgi:hypothetical protein